VSIGRAVSLLGAGIICGSLLAAAEGRARAAAFSVSLEYVAGPDCPDVADFKAVVVARLGHDPFSDGASDHVLVRMAPRDGALDGRIEWRDAKGRWVGDQSFPLITTDCLRLARSMGFALAVQIQLLEQTGAAPAAAAPRKVEPPELAPAPLPPAPAPPAPVPSPELAATPEAAGTAPSQRPAFALGAGPSIGFGMSSTPILLGRVLGALAWPHVSVELAAEVSVPATTRRADGAGFSQQHLLASAAACGLVTRWNACFLVNAGEVRMAGEDIAHPTSARVPVVEVGARVGVLQSLGRRGFLNAHADGLTILTRWTATLDQVPVWTAPRFAAALGLDVGVRFR
jgi:hypothetical protein